MQNSAQFRLGPPIFDLVEEWRRAQPKIPARADAVRELLRRALVSEQKNAPPRDVARTAAWARLLERVQG
jgi:hypothetical protein